MIAQEPPDILDVNVAQCLGQQRPGPARKLPGAGLSNSRRIRLSVAFV